MTTVPVCPRESARRAILVATMALLLAPALSANDASSIEEPRWNDRRAWSNRFETSTTRSRGEILSILLEHAAHHRGQATAYLRLQGIRPPNYVD